MKSVKYEKALEIARNRGPKSDICKMLKDASSSGDPRADYALAICYFQGKYGLTVDEKKGLKLLKRAAKFDIAEAIYDLASHYDQYDQEDIDIFYLYMRAALLGHKKACKQVYQFYNEGKTVTYNAALVREWKKRAGAEDGLISPPWRINLS
jgi:TPR repeat protein